MALGCFVSTGRSIEQSLARVQRAEELGYESAYVTHIAGRESLTVVTAYAMRTQRSASAPASCRSTRARPRRWRRRRPR